MTFDPTDVLDPANDLANGLGDIDFGEGDDPPTTEETPPTDDFASNEAILTALLGPEPTQGPRPDPRINPQNPVAAAQAEGLSGLELADRFDEPTLSEAWTESGLGAVPFGDLNPTQIALYGALTLSRGRAGVRSPAQIAQAEQDAEDEANAEPSIFEALSPSEFDSLVKTLKQGANLSESTLSRADQKALRPYLS